MSKTAIVIGATGVVGREVVQQLLNCPEYNKVITFARSHLELPDEILKQHIVDFADIQDWQDLIQGDDLYICMGTTLKQAGSKAAQQKIDLDYPVQFAEIARNHNISRVALVSSTGANASSASFYLRLKGQLEQQLINLNFEQTVIVQPSVLVGERREFRIGEECSKVLLNVLRWMPIIKKYRPITGKQVATALIALMLNNQSTTKKLDQLFDY